MRETVTSTRDLPPDVVVVAGEIDLTTRHEIVDVVRRAVPACPAALVLDLSVVTFIDCSGLSGILEARELAAEHHCRLVVVSPSPPVERLLRLTGTLSVLTQSS